MSDPSVTPQWLQALNDSVETINKLNLTTARVHFAQSGTVVLDGETSTGGTAAFVVYGDPELRAMARRFPYKGAEKHRLYAELISVGCGKHLISRVLGISLPGIYKIQKELNEKTK